MICKQAVCYNFRNIENETLSFDREINILSGDNAAGKTSVLEGIYLCAQGRSHRTSREKDFLRFGSSLSGLTIVYEDRERENRLGITWSEKGRRHCEKNGIPVRRMSEFIGNFRAVLFTPEHLSIVKEGPSMRRAFLDGALSQLDRQYVASLQRYTAILMRRNKILADAGINPSLLETIDIFSRQLSEEAAFLSEKREEYTRRADGYLQAVFEDMTGGREKPSLSYTGARSEKEFYRELTENLPRELRFGSTLFGIHKDDITVCLNGREARSFASQGQQRSLSLALKLAEGEISREETGEYPVFLFDDVFSELDGGRKEYLMKGLSGRQVILTTCEKEGFSQNSNIIYAENGRFRRAAADRR